MTRDEAVENGVEYVSIPCGKCGMLIQFKDDVAGVQIPGEEDIRWVLWDDIKEVDGIGVMLQVLAGN